jgi:aquaporin Z
MQISQCASEFVGTFFFVLTVGFNVLQNAAMAPFSTGGILMAMVSATGKVSGGHFNPAVTVGVLLRGKIDKENAMVYACSQLLGGLAASCVYTLILGATFTLQPGHGYTLVAAGLVEVLFTAALVFVVLSVATTEQDNDNWYFGLAIGFTVMAAAFAIGPISGCSLNPALSFGVMVSNLLYQGHMQLPNFLVYTVSPCIGATLAAMLFRIIRAEEYNIHKRAEFDTYGTHRSSRSSGSSWSYNSNRSGRRVFGRAGLGSRPVPTLQSRPIGNSLSAEPATISPASLRV